MQDIGTFSRRMKIRENNFVRNSEKFYKSIADEMLIEVILQTPADTGAARSNWQVGVNSLPSDVLKPYSPGIKLGIGESSNANAAISVGRSILAGATTNDVVYFANNVPYISRLNDGYSAQAPANFIQKAFDRARKRIQKERSLFD